MGKELGKVLPPKVEPSQLSRNLRLLRQLQGVSQQQLAEALQVKRNNIASFEGGIVEPRPEVFLAIARYFAIDPADLLTKDLSLHPAEQVMRQVLPHGPAMQIPAELFDTFISKTFDCQKILDGFLEFYKLKDERRQTDGPHSKSLRHDLENLLDILDKLLKTNWDFIRGMK